MKIIIHFVSIIGWVAVFSVSAVASDLDDGISSYTDDRISEADQLGSADVNFSFIEVRAKAQAGMITSSLMTSKIDGQFSGLIESSMNGSQNGNINSVVLYPGTAVYGDIIIVDTSTGDKTQLVFGDSYSSSVGSDLDIDNSINQIGNINE